MSERETREKRNEEEREDREEKEIGEIMKEERLNSLSDDVIVNVVTGQPISRTASLAAAPFPGVKLHLEQSTGSFKFLDQVEEKREEIK